MEIRTVILKISTLICDIARERDYFVHVITDALDRSAILIDFQAMRDFKRVHLSQLHCATGFLCL